MYYWNLYSLIHDVFICVLESSISWFSSIWVKLSSIILHTILSRLSIATVLSPSDNIPLGTLMLLLLWLPADCPLANVIWTWAGALEFPWFVSIGISSLLSDVSSGFERSGNASNASCIVSCTLSRCSLNFSATWKCMLIYLITNVPLLMSL